MTSLYEHGGACRDPGFELCLIKAIHEASPDGILVVNEEERVISYNRRFFEVFRMAPGELPIEDGERLTDIPLLSRLVEIVKEPDRFLQCLQALYADPDLDDISEIVLKDGRTLEHHTRALWRDDHQYLGRVWYFRDITAHKQNERALKEVSDQDSLTRVANRRRFSERAAEEFARARRSGGRLSFIMLDLDNFKAINDQWGHEVGDHVLKSFCDCSRMVMRQEDLFARIGGEEFAVLLPDTDLEGAFMLSERLRQCALEQSAAEGSAAIHYTFSAGVASLAPSDTSIESLWRRADKAMYVAKRSGRNRTMYEESKADGIISGGDPAPEDIRTRTPLRLSHKASLK